MNSLSFQVKIQNLTKCFIFIFTLGLSLSANSQIETLRPETGYFSSFKHQDDYYPIVRKILCDSLSFNPKARIIVKPSFSPEYVISIDFGKGFDYLTYRIANEQIWDLPKPKNKIKCTTYRIKFDSKVSDKIQAVLFSAISKAKFAASDGGLDGTSFIFLTSKSGYGMIGGEVWSPYEETKDPGLINIAGWLKKCAMEGKILDKDNMIQRIDDLIKNYN